MRRSKPNKIPSNRIIAKHYAAGHVVDYPADAILEAVNDQRFFFTYDPAAIPLQESFADIFWLNLNVLKYLAKRPLQVSDEASFVMYPMSYINRWSTVHTRKSLNEIVANFIMEISKPPLYQLANGKTSELISYLATHDLRHLRHVDVPDNYFMNFSEQSSYYLFEHNIDYRGAGFGPDFATNIVILVNAIFVK